MLLEENNSFGVAGRGSIILTWLLLVVTEASRIVAGSRFRKNCSFARNSHARSMARQNAAGQ